MYERKESDLAYLTKFLVLILGALTPPPTMLAPVMKIPLKKY